MRLKGPCADGPQGNRRNRGTQGAKAKTSALRFRAYGKREYLTLGTDGWTQARAQEELENVLADVRRGIWRPPSRQAVEPAPDPSFHEFGSEWFDRHRQELRPRSQEDYAWALSHHLLPFIAGHRLSEITIE